MNNLSEVGLIRQKQLLPLVGFSAPTLWRKVKAGSFPQPIKIGEKMTAWRMEEIRNWMNTLSQ